MSVTKVKYIHTATTNWNASNFIDTDIRLSSDNFRLRMVYLAKGVGSDRVFGFFPSDGVSDSNDLRYFNVFANTNTIDIKDSRFQYGSPYLVNNKIYDITLGNAYLECNGERVIDNSPIANINKSNTIRVDVGSQYVSLFQIWDDDNLVFDGYAAVDDEGHVGLYDEISGELKYNSGLSMAYEVFPDQHITTKTISALYIGSEKYQRAYLGSELIFGKKPQRGGWVFVDSSNFDRTLPLTKCRFHIVNVPVRTPQFSATEGCFSEFQNKNTDGVYCGTLSQSEWGNPKKHKFNMVYGGGKYTSGDENEINISTLPEVESGVYELTFPTILYWSGVEAADTTPIYANGNLIEVFVNFEEQPNDEIWYWTSNGDILPQIKESGGNNYKTVWGDANLISNTYEGKGIMKFDKPITIIPHRAFWGANGMIELSFPASITEFEGPYFNLDGLETIEKIYFHTKPYVKSNGDYNIYVESNPNFSTIYVPDDYIDEYREQPTFSHYRNKLTPISESL